MNLPCPSVSILLWLFPVVAACSSTDEPAKEASVGGGGKGGVSVAHVGGSNAAAKGGTSAAPTVGSSPMPVGGSGSVPMGGVSSASVGATGGVIASPVGGSGPNSDGGSKAAPAGGISSLASSANGGKGSAGTVGTLIAGGGMNTGGEPAATNTQICTGLAPACPNANGGSGGANGSAGGATSTAGATATAGSSAGGTHSRVIALDPDTNIFAAYDAEGQLVHDYGALLDFGAGFGDRVVCIDTSGYSWDSTAINPFFATTVLAPPRQDPPLAPTELIVTAKAASATKPAAKVRVASVSGQVTDEFSISGNWQGFVASPTRQYLQGATSGSNGIIVRRSDHSSVWQGPLFQAGFSPDDKHLIVLPASSGNAALMVELNTGRATTYDLSKLPAGFESPTDLFVRGTFNSGAVLTGNRHNGAQSALYWASWDGSFAPLDPTLPAGVDAWTVTARRDATKLAFLRTAEASAQVDPLQIGWFELDVGTKDIRALPKLNDTSQDCYDTVVSTYYTLSDGTLSSFSCTTAACDVFASWTPPSDFRWEPELVVSPQRGFVGVQYLWQSQMVMTSNAPSRIYNAQGALLLANDSGPFGDSFGFDRLDQLALVRTYTPPIGTAVYSTASAHTTPIGNPARLAFGYE